MERVLLDELAEGAIILNGFDDCIIGITEEFGGLTRILYSKDMIISKLCKDMSSEEAYEYFDFNIIGGYFGEQNPIFLVVGSHPHV